MSLKTLDLNEQPKAEARHTFSGLGLVLALLLVSAALVLPSASKAQPAGQEAVGFGPSVVTVESLEILQGEETAILRTTARGPLVYTHYRGEEGNFVLELANAVPAAGIGDVRRNDGLVTWVQLFAERLAGGQPLTRIVVHTAEPSETTLQATDGVVSISFRRVDSVSASAPRGRELDSTLERSQPGDKNTGAGLSRIAGETVAADSTSPRNPVPTGTVASPTTASIEPAAVRTIQERSATKVGRPARELLAIELERRGGRGLFHLRADGDIDFSTLTLPSPPRFVVDLHGVTNNSGLGTLSAATEYVDKVRVAQFRQPPEAIARVVFDLTTSEVPLVELGTGELLVHFAARAGSPTAPPAEPAVKPPAPAPSPAQSPAPSPELTAEPAPLLGVPPQAPVPPDIDPASRRAPIAIPAEPLNRPEPRLTPPPTPPTGSPTPDPRADAPITVDSSYRPPLSPNQLMATYIEAFNEANIERLVGTMTEDVEWFTVNAAGAALEASGRPALARSMRSYFDSVPDVHAEIEQRMINGNFVTTRERLTWKTPSGLERSQASIAVFELREGLIRRAWYYPAQ